MQQTSIRHATLSAGPLLVASAATLAVLATMRPHLAGSPASWHGDDLAFATTWLVAVVCAAWLTISTAAWLAAIAGGCFTVAARVADWAPPVACRFLQAALVTTFAVAPTAAHAAPAAPVVVEVGPGGRLASVPRAVTVEAAPVVRAPRPTTTLSPPPAPTTRPAPTTIPAPTSTTSMPTFIPPVVVPTSVPPTVREPIAPRPSASPAPSVETQRPTGTYVVRAGDNLWNIARREVARTSGVARPDDHAIADYWELVIGANRPTLRSGDPNLIYPGEPLHLPAQA